MKTTAMGDLDGVTMQDQVVNEFKGPYFPFNRREHYPRQLKVDFRKLTVSDVEFGSTSHGTSQLL